MIKKLAIGISVIIVLTFILTGIGYYWLARDLPSIDTLEERFTPPSVRITDQLGRLLYEVLPSEGGRHTSVPLDEIPLACQQAAIATEDRYFYQNPGIDIYGILRALWINLQGGQVRAGGSTITQQVIRTLLLSENERYEVSLHRKLREALLAWQLTRKLSKDEILALYLNHTNYGGLSYGIEAAAQTFFGKSSMALDTAECALLAGLPQSPVLYNPYTDPEAAKKRQEVVLRLMAEQGYLNDTERLLNASEPLTYANTPYPIEAPHFVMMVRSQLDSLFTPEEIYAQGGLIVQTTLNLDWQHLAEHAVSTQVRKVQVENEGIGHNLNSSALIAIDPSDGAIRSLVGSPDYFDNQNGGAINMAISPRQPGSSLKPLVYAAAFDPENLQPWTPATMILDVSTTFTTREGEPYIPKNYDGLEHGPVLIRQALGSSLNIPAVITLNHIGLPALFQLANQMGIDTLQDPNQFDLSLALGGGDVSLMELTAAYGSFANGGLRVVPYAIERVTTPEGELLYEADHPPQPRVLDERVAWLISDILSDDDARLLGFGRNSVLRLDRPAAVKTGTTTNWHDNWTIGYTPEIVVGVWAGNTNYEPMRDITGLTGAAPIWHQFIREALSGTPESSFNRPDGLVKVEVCALTGMLPSENCPYTRLEWFIAGTEPHQIDRVYQRITIDAANRILADENTPVERRKEVVVLDLPPSARHWAQSQGISLLSDFLSTNQTNSVAEIIINHPAPNSIYRITSNLPAENQRIPLRVSTNTPFSEISLWLDGQELITFDAPPYEYWWTLTEGAHQLQASGKTPDGNTVQSTTTTFDVIK